MKTSFCIIVLLVLCTVLSFSQNEMDSVKSVPPVADSTTQYDHWIVEVAPECLNYSQVQKWIKYPEEAKYDEIEGKVIIKLLIDTDGKIIKEGKISGPPVFFKEVQRVAWMLVFSPASIAGTKVKVWVSVPFNFILQKDK